MPIRLSAFLLAALALGGCGAAADGGVGKFDGEEQKVATVVADLGKAAQRRDTGEICGKLLSPTLVKRLDADSSCPQELKATISDVDAYAVTVDDVSITGNRARARVTGPAGEDSVAGMIQLERAGAGWKISDLAVEPARR